MALVNFLRLFSILSLAILNISLSPLPVGALAVDRSHIGRSPNHAHAGLAKRQNSSGRCRPRPSSSPESTNPTYAPTSEPAPTSQGSPHTTTTTTTHTPTYTPTSSKPANFNKLGLGFSNYEEECLPNIIPPHSQPRLIMNWDYNKYEGVITLPSNALYVPTIRDNKVDWTKVIETLSKQDNSRIILCFNEPNIKGQANLTPEMAHQLTLQFILPLKQHHGYKLVSPAVTNDAHKWTSDFLGLGYSGIDYVGYHYYGIHGADFKRSVEQFATFGLPMIISEIGVMDYSTWAQGSPEQFNDVFNTALDVCKNDERIMSCMWFGWFRADEIPGSLGGDNAFLTCPGDLPSKDCKPNARGYTYLNY